MQFPNLHRARSCAGCWWLRSAARPQARDCSAAAQALRIGLLSSWSTGKLFARGPRLGWSRMILLDLVGGVALLLWGLHMVRSGVVRAFGSDLRRFLAVALRNRFLAFMAGLLVTALLQSSTATGL